MFQDFERVNVLCCPSVCCGALLQPVADGEGKVGCRACDFRGYAEVIDKYGYKKLVTKLHLNERLYVLCDELIPENENVSSFLKDNVFNMIVCEDLVLSITLSL